MVQLQGTPEITGDPDANTVAPTQSVTVSTLSAKQKQSLLTLVTQQLSILISYLSDLLVKQTSLAITKIYLSSQLLNATSSVKTQQQTVTTAATSTETISATSAATETVQMLPVTARQPKTSTASQRIAKHESNLVNDAITSVDTEIKKTRSDIAKLKDLQNQLSV